MTDRHHVHGSCGHDHSHARGPGLSRRGFLSTAAGVGAAAAIAAAIPGPIGRAFAAVADGSIDTHHHIFPPIFAQMWEHSPGWTPNSSDPVLPLTRRWSPSWMIERLDEANVQMAVVSNNDRGFTATLSTQDRRSLARQVNEYAAQLAHDHPGRIGTFAYLPLPDVDGALAEIAHAYETLHVDGIHMMTSYSNPAGHGDLWLGDPHFTPMLEELDRRAATVFVHPKAPDCCRGLMPYVPAEYTTLIEYPYDTGHTIVSLLVTGALARFRRINWLFCHTGAVIPVLANRFDDGATDSVQMDFARVAPQGITAELQRLNWDTAGYTSKPAMDALLDFTTIDHVLFGSDTPFVTPLRNERYLATTGLNAEQMHKIHRENALRLMPTLRQRLAAAA